MTHTRTYVTCPRCGQGLSDRDVHDNPAPFAFCPFCGLDLRDLDHSRESKLLDA